jgi:NADP-dependent aldehyde dehydrogenase
MELTGANIIAGAASVQAQERLRGVNPRSGEELRPAVAVATREELELAVSACAEVASDFGATPPATRRWLLERIATVLEEHEEDIVALADRESGLGEPRLRSELARTTAQFRFLGSVASEGSYLDATIDRQAHIRSYSAPLGIVAVFAASNFPLAFGVAGGDTASALAVGCPVVVKAHPSQPLTSELLARLMTDAIADTSVDAGVLSVVHGFSAGEDLVQHPAVQAVAFTGSYRGGMALSELAGSREVPIPVYAEMGSLNPVVISPGAIETRLLDIVQGYVESFSMGTGQFCTKPGLLYIPASAADDVEIGVQKELAKRDPMPLLNTTIYEAWRERTHEWAQNRQLFCSQESDDRDGSWAAPAVIRVQASELADSASLREECFGPTSLLVVYDDLIELRASLASLPGSLTAAIHVVDEETSFVLEMHEILESRVGRLIHNAWPTGVAVTWAMHHGGPYPATTDGAHTSVGARAVRRFVRPVCFQGVDERFLPGPIRSDNPWAVPQRIDGKLRL